MRRRGNCWDNAVAESFFSSLKNERIKKHMYKNRELTPRTFSITSSRLIIVHGAIVMSVAESRRVRVGSPQGAETCPLNPGNSS